MLQRSMNMNTWKAMKNDHSWIYKHFDRVEKNIDVVKVYGDIEMFYRSQGC